jgi:hypothetical protein
MDLEREQRQKMAEQSYMHSLPQPSISRDVQRQPTASPGRTVSTFGHALYGKLSAGIVLITAALWLLADARGRAMLRTSGPWIALAAFLIVFAPLAKWLAGGGLQVIVHYWVQRGLNKFSALRFVGLQCIMILPMLAVLWRSGLLARRGEPRGDKKYPDFQRIVRYIWMTLVPDRCRCGRRDDCADRYEADVRRADVEPDRPHPRGYRRPQSGGFQSARIEPRRRRVEVSLTTVFGNQLRRVPDRQTGPRQKIATRMRQKEAGRPLRIIAGENTNWVAGLVAISGRDIAHAFTSADYTLSPWVTPADVARDRALVV